MKKDELIRKLSELQGDEVLIEVSRRGDDWLHFHDILLQPVSSRDAILLCPGLEIE